MWQDRGELKIPSRQQIPQNQPVRKKDFWTDQISTGGGIGGALGGAALGASIGSVVPVIGTAIGGLAGGILGGALGSGAGELGENFITGEEDKFKNVGQEALLGGIFSAPPIRAGKALIGAGNALRTGAGAAGARTAAETALTQPGIFSQFGQGIRGSARGVEAGAKAGGSRITPAQANELNTFLEKTVKVKGTTVPKQLDSLGRFISTKNDELAGAISQSNRALTATERRAITSSINDQISKNVIARTPAQQRIVDDIVVRIGQSKDVKSLDDVRKLIDQSINFGRNSASPDTAAEQIYKLVRSSLTDEVATRVGAAKPLKEQLSKALRAEELLLSRAGSNQSAIAAPLSIATIPIPNRLQQAGQNVVGRVASGVGRLTDAAGRSGVSGLGTIPTVARQTIGRGITGTNMGTPGEQPTLDQALMQQSDFGQPTVGSIFDRDMQTQQAVQPQTSPYPLENLQADITRDPANAQQYIEYYNNIQSVFSPEQQGGDLSQTGITALAGLDNSLQNLDEVESVLNQYKGAFDPIRGRFRKLNPYDQEAVAINQASLIAAQNIGRALEGGKLTDADIARYQDALPGIQDTAQGAQEKIDRLRRLIANQRQNYLGLQSQYGGARTGGLEDALLQAQQGAF